MEKTLILVKPDGVQRCLAGKIISRLERRGLKIIFRIFLIVFRNMWRNTVSP